MTPGMWPNAISRSKLAMDFVACSRPGSMTSREFLESFQSSAGLLVSLHQPIHLATGRVFSKDSTALT